MKIQPLDLTARNLVPGYHDDGEGGVVGYGGALGIRMPFQRGICPYILTRDERHLHIRAFTDGMKQRIYEQQVSKRAICDDKFDISDMEADHKGPWSAGGKTVEENCQTLCRKGNREKSAQ